MNSTEDQHTSTDRPLIISARARKRLSEKKRSEDLEAMLTRALDTIENLKTRVAQLEVYRPPQINRSMVAEQVSAEVRHGDTLDLVSKRLARSLTSSLDDTMNGIFEKTQETVRTAISSMNVEATEFQIFKQAVERKAEIHARESVKAVLEDKWDAEITTLVNSYRGTTPFNEALHRIVTKVVDQFMIDRVLSKIAAPQQISFDPGAFNPSDGPDR